LGEGEGKGEREEGTTLRAQPVARDTQIEARPGRPQLGLGLVPRHERKASDTSRRATWTHGGVDAGTVSAKFLRGWFG